MDALPPRPRTPLPPLAAVAVAATAALLGGCTAAPLPAGPAAAGPRVPATAPTRAAAEPRQPGDLQSEYQTVIKNVLPSVVTIEAGDSLGSGVVYDAEGHIVTNAHVVGSARSFRVTIATREQPVAARLVSSYPEQDLAVIKLEGAPPEGVRPARFGDSAKVEVGQIVLAMGAPLGLSGSVTQGIVSAIGRTVSEGDSGGGTGATIGNMVQTSAPINPGNSGGALVNLDSEVIGIPTLAAADPELGGGTAPGIGFAIPVSMVRTVADQIVKYGSVRESGRAALGISGRTVLDDDYRPAGVAVERVTEDGAAQAAGLRVGDIITRVGGDEITTITSLLEALASMQPGQRVQVRYLREGKGRTAQVTLGEM
ncbi:MULTISPECIES: S1C family serine protease [Streptomyces]|uniref:Periplasmic pH-dependent serine endoprotease DegQ n=3 Tax=Streptomyces TaxID=1883 RepID=A0A1D8FZF6_9ACTN|nr:MULTISPECIES: trypsin-like peptidase domain-containing protein [Streptomyces]AOT58543.1 Periplasmic pH-dependent serine endoprotease DegQ precursor [Streptomyces rubrolavendulae]KAF0648533.1 signal protein PDZ [Streptomyces fradiae ATCC 10745 = DSM 40063]OSY53812.1 Periplasmic pH-dependent serine endoprotease DegQ precursor [Streptomyces fradiae ATCC 10745 = DSM 40063]QEV11882.1 PDZ domain-containing protein [Streptomyces fradiae ATCC 10745 = DSM 40063]UQS28489.1 trypsin-like peptidase doma